MATVAEKVEVAIAAIQRGEMVILVDDEGRENEGDLILAAEKCTPEAINFMATHARGLICLPMSKELVERLRLPMMVTNNEAPLGTAFTVSIEAREGVTTGISASDRSTTVLAAVADDAKPYDIVCPGHIFPLKARDGGVLVRMGQTEGAVDLSKMAGLKPAGVICEIMKPDGEMARMAELEVFSEKHNIPILSVADMVTYRLQKERIVRCDAQKQIRPQQLGAGEPFDVRLYKSDVEDTEYVVFIRGDLEAANAAGEAVDVRVHSCEPAVDVFGTKTDAIDILRYLDKQKTGVFMYVVGGKKTVDFDALTKISAAPQIAGPVSSETMRDYGLGAQVLVDVGCRNIRLHTRTKRRLIGIESFGINIVEQVVMKKGIIAKEAS